METLSQVEKEFGGADVFCHEVCIGLWVIGCSLVMETLQCPPGAVTEHGGADGHSSRSALAEERSRARGSLTSHLEDPETSWPSPRLARARCSRGS